MLTLGKSRSKGIQEFSTLFLKLQRANKTLCSYILKYLHLNSEILMLFYKQESLSQHGSGPALAPSGIFLFTVKHLSIRERKMQCRMESIGGT